MPGTLSHLSHLNPIIVVITPILQRKVRLKEIM